MTDRRDFLKLMGWALGSMMLTSCGGGSGVTSSGGAGVQSPASQTTALLPVRWPISGPVVTTAQQQVFPLAVPATSRNLDPREVPQYAQAGYGAWQTGPGTSYPGDPSSNPNPRANPNNPAHDLRTDLAPGYSGTNVARLLHFFTMSDVHLADKESPAQALLFGWIAPYGSASSISAWSPVIVSTTQVLDAAIQTINALHETMPFDFGLSLGDQSNNCQYNELRWFIDCMDGKVIVPSSGDNLGASSIDYQRPFQAVGLNPRIPWYACVGNHDHVWQGACYENAVSIAAHVGSQVLDINVQATFQGILDTTGFYMGVTDGTSTWGNLIKYGVASQLPVQTVAPDSNRRTLESYVTASDGSVSITSTTLNFMSEFFNTTTTPVGHGFKADNLANDTAYYTFLAKSDLPLKVIVLNDNPQTSTATDYAMAALDPTQLQWLENELQLGQAANQLMIIAAHIPIYPQNSLTDPTRASMWLDPNQEAQVLALVQSCPNVIMWLAGHRHVNVITPQPSPDPTHPELGFWEVETPSLRDFPQGFRSIDIRRNSDNTLSILVTTVDPAVTPGTPAGNSRGYSVAAAQTFGTYPRTSTASQVYNAELVVQLTPAMQARLATQGTPL